MTQATKVKKEKKQTEQNVNLKASLYDTAGKKIKEITLPVNIFGFAWNDDLVHQVMRVKLANSRKVLAHTKGRSEVKGGGTKPWRQKGTGRARHGSIRSPLWVGGGVTFGPTKERVYKLRINKKMNRKAILIVLSQKLRDQELVFVQDFKLAQGKTKELGDILNKLPSKNKSILMVLPKSSIEFSRAVGNLKKVGICLANKINVLDLLKYKYLILLESSVGLIENTFSEKENKVTL
jgi:large subunit ribosomal protein L4